MSRGIYIYASVCAYIGWIEKKKERKKTKARQKKYPTRKLEIKGSQKLVLVQSSVQNFRNF